MSKDKIEQAIKMILKNMLVHMIYMVEHDDTGSINFIFISNDRIGEDMIVDLENALCRKFKCEINLISMYDFDIPDRIDIMKRAELVYCESKVIKQIFEIELNTAYKTMMDERKRFIERKSECATYYIQ